MTFVILITLFSYQTKIIAPTSITLFSYHTKIIAPTSTYNIIRSLLFATAFFNDLISHYNNSSY